MFIAENRGIRTSPSGAPYSLVAPTGSRLYRRLAIGVRDQAKWPAAAKLADFRPCLYPDLSLVLLRIPTGLMKSEL